MDPTCIRYRRFMAFWRIRSSSELKHLFYHINRVGVRIGPAFAFCSHHLTAHVGPLYEWAEVDLLFWAHVRESPRWALQRRKTTGRSHRGCLLVFLFYAHGLGWSSRDPRETATTQPSSWASPMSSPSGPRM